MAVATHKIRTPLQKWRAALGVEKYLGRLGHVAERVVAARQPNDENRQDDKARGNNEPDRNQPGQAAAPGSVGGRRFRHLLHLDGTDKGAVPFTLIVLDHWEPGTALPIVQTNC